ncbi:hypothetical protein KR018_006989 [Drosophila ironensis]|nr:hypothetical protein KR018_006989 [Drosophila ironensis]
MAKIVLFCLLSLLACAAGQRITTIHLDGVQYFISRMNPYSPELNYFLAYQYCRSLGLQLASFETKEKAESMTTYLKNAGYGNYDFWTSGNRLGTGMFLWMSTGLPFNATFDFFENSADAIQAGLLDPVDHNSNTSPQRTARDSSSGAEKGCVILKQPTLKWMPEDCSAVKDFICEQTRCYYYNYGSIPVSSAQGRPITSTTPRTPASLINLHAAATTTPLPLLMSTSGLYTAAKAKSSHRIVEDTSSSSQQQPSFISFKLNHDRSLPDTDAADVDVEDQETDVEEHEEHDDHEAEGEEEHEDEHEGEHARELSGDSDGDIKEHVFPLSDNELHPEMHSIEEVQQQLQQEQEDQDAVASAQGAEDNDSSLHDAEETEGDAESEAPAQSSESLTLPSSTESPAAAIEERIKQIAQDFQKMASSQELQPKEELTPQSSLSLNDLIRTLRPNEQQIIPQIDSDYSNAMRVLGKPLVATN